MTESVRDTQGGELANRTVGELMRRHFIRLSPDDSLLDADQLMRMARVRTLPVVEDEMLLGVVAHRDLQVALLDRLDFRHVPDGREALQHLRIRQMTLDPDSVAPETPVRRAAAQLCALRLGCLPVIEAGPQGARMLGIITEADLLRACYEDVGRRS